MIDTILFDLVGVLLFPNESYKASRQVDEIDELIGAVTDDSIFREEVYQKYNLDERELNTILQSIVNKYEPFVPLWELLPRLRRRYKLGIINNGTYLTYPLFEAALHISQQFDAFISSAVVGVGKPNPGIYQQAYVQLKSKPQNCLFMDDSEINVLGAQAAGLQTIHWLNKESGFEKFKAHLCNTGEIKAG